jgi:hypothetical protein
MKRRLVVLKNQRKLTLTFLSIILILFLSSSCIGTNGKKVKDILHLNEEIKVTITEVYFNKNYVEVKDDIKINITVEQLIELFLEKAVVVNGITVNYAFGYEGVMLLGVINNNDKLYKFDYNLAGFGTIYLTDKEYILFGDMSKSIPEQ